MLYRFKVRFDCILHEQSKVKSENFLYFRKVHLKLSLTKDVKREDPISRHFSSCKIIFRKIWECVHCPAGQLYKDKKLLSTQPYLWESDTSTILLFKREEMRVYIGVHLCYFSPIEIKEIKRKKEGKWEDRGRKKKGSLNSNRIRCLLP